MTVKGIGPVTVHAHRPYFHRRDFREHWQLLMMPPATEHSAD